MSDGDVTDRGSRKSGVTHALSFTHTPVMAYSCDNRTDREHASRVTRAMLGLSFVGLLLITRSVVGSFCELLEVMLY